MYQLLYSRTINEEVLSLQYLQVQEEPFESEW